VRWITWDQQSDLAKLIRYYIDTGSCTGILIDRLIEEHPTYTKFEVCKELTFLSGLWLIIHDPEQDWWQVTYWAHDGLEQAFKRAGWGGWKKGLTALRDRGVYHPKMLDLKLVAKEEVP
jgi:hypothetical protein